MTTATERPNLKITPIKPTPWYALPLIAVMVLSLIYVSINIRFILTESVDATVVWEIGGDPNVGDYVSFNLTNPVIPTPDNTVLVTKILICSQGQNLIREDDQWTCDGEVFGENRTFALNGDKLEQFYFNGLIPEGKGFVIGNGENSFDSRYWGFIDLDEATVVAKVF